MPSIYSILYCVHLARPCVQVWDDLREEQRRVMELFGSDITLESLDAMIHATAVVKEGLRARPMVPFVFKRAAESFELDGYHIPVGMQVNPLTENGWC